MIRLKNFPFLVFLLTHVVVCARDTEQEQSHPPPIGNFSLPVSQQPSKFISIGENNIEKGQLLLAVFADAYLGKHSYSTDVIPNVLYGITNELTILLGVPFSPRNKDHDAHSSGMEDVFAQLEYTIYNEENTHASNQATIVAGVTFPTGSSTKTPPTGFGSNAFLLGITYSHMTVDWYYLMSPGVVLTTSKHGTKFGEQFLYQFGLGRNLPSPQMNLRTLGGWNDKVA